MHKKTMQMMLLRAIEGAETGGSVGVQSTPGNAQNGGDTAGSREEKGGDSEQPGSRDVDIDVDKIRHDISAEWSGRFDAEKERADALQKKLDEYEKSKMSEEERAAAAEKEWKARVDQLMAENEEMKLKQERKNAALMLKLCRRHWDLIVPRKTPLRGRVGTMRRSRVLSLKQLPAI